MAFLDFQDRHPVPGMAGPRLPQAGDVQVRHLADLGSDECGGVLEERPVEREGDFMVTLTGTAVVVPEARLCNSDSGWHGGPGAVRPSGALEGRTGEPATGPGIRLWAGRIADAFYIDLSLLGMVNSAVRGGTALDLSEWRPDRAQNSFAGTTVDSIVLEVSQQHPQLRPGARIGVWCATKLATDAGGWRQINRAGHPMMWPIFWPDDTHFTDPANTRHPSEDFAACLLRRWLRRQ